jgi:hypothetical protein
MPSSKPISPRMEAALLECFLSATRLLPLRLRSSFVLIGGAASVFRGSTYDAIASGATQFKRRDPLQTIEFHASQDFVVHLELLQLGGGFVDSIAVYEPFYDGFIASRADLLALRGVTVADRGKDGDFLDFKFLLRTTVKKGLLLPQLDESMLAALKEAAGKLSWVDALVLSSLLREDNFVQFHSL